VLHAGLTGSGKWPPRLQALPDIPSGSGVGAQGPDHLTFDLADASKLSLSFYGKRPGPGMRLDKLSMQFAMHETGFISDVLEAYERLILDAMRGDRTPFTTAEGIERLWEVSMPLRDAPPPVQPYPPGAWDQNPSISSSPSCLAAAVRARLARSQPSGQLTRSLSTAIEFEIPFEY
jgi:Glucose-6-phosphate dehydrogenase, C-terminal domain